MFIFLVMFIFLNFIKENSMEFIGLLSIKVLIKI